ncbi:MAG: hypothetical protein KGI28_03105 [Thaumarchaeota archaeon]|nr:hypothetical protein [Nitrososphaerota archaeon]
MKLNPLQIVSLTMFGLSVVSFLAMKSYQSHLAGWAAVVFGFAAIIAMIVSGLKKLKAGKIAKPGV